MTLQFEHNNFFRKELKEQKSFMEYMNKELDDMSKEFYGLRSQFAHLEKLIAQILDKQATLVNKMAAKPEDLEGNKDEDLKVIDVSPIKSLFCNMNLDNDGTGDELIEAKVSRLSMRWWISLWWKSTLTIRLRTCEDVAP